MRRIINSTFISLDGVIEKPHLWPDLEGSGGDGTAIQTELLMGCDAVLMGRRTHEGFAPAWQARSGDSYSDRINSMRKYVVSSTLQNPGWDNTHVISGDLISAVKRLIAQRGMDIVQYGFGPVSFALLEAGLLDQLRLWVHPVFIGIGGPEDLLYRQCPPASFRLGEVKTLQNGIVILTYHAR